MLNSLHRWIDPRIGSVRVADLRAYLARRGWTSVATARPHQLCFREPPGETEEPIVLALPAGGQFADGPQRILEAVTLLAETEDRYAVDVLNDILGTTSPHPSNGSRASVPPPPEVARA